MKKIFLLLILLLLLILTGCQQNSFTLKREFEENYYSGLVIEPEDNTGDISIENWDKNKVKITAIIIGRADTKIRAEDIANRTEINTRFDNNTLKIRQYLPERPQGLKNSISVSYFIKIPEKFSAGIITNTGNINTGVVNGNIDIEINTGTLKLFEVYGDLTIDGNTGDVLIDYLRGQANIDINTGKIKGNLLLEKDSINKIKTSTGDIYLFLYSYDALNLIAKKGTGELSIINMDFDQTQINNNTFTGYIGDGSTKLETRSSTGDIIIRGN